MNLKTFETITSFSKKKKFEASRKYNAQGHSCVPYEELIVTNDNYKDNYFLVHKNMIFEKGLCDSSYDVYRFDLDGKFLDKDDYNKSFFRNMKVMKKI
jgi:hypothetical protein